MPRKSLVTEENQPSIKMLLLTSPSCTKPKCTQYDPLSLDTTCDSDTELISSKNTSMAKKGNINTDQAEAPKTIQIKNP